VEEDNIIGTIDIKSIRVIYITYNRLNLLIRTEDTGFIFYCGSMKNIVNAI
jgi:hypothetical protein